MLLLEHTQQSSRHPMILAPLSELNYFLKNLISQQCIKIHPQKNIATSCEIFFTNLGVGIPIQKTDVGNRERSTKTPPQSVIVFSMGLGGLVRTHHAYDIYFFPIHGLLFFRSPVSGEERGRRKRMPPISHFFLKMEGGGLTTVTNMTSILSLSILCRIPGLWSFGGGFQLSGLKRSGQSKKKKVPKAFRARNPGRPSMPDMEVCTRDSVGVTEGGGHPVPLASSSRLWRWQTRWRWIPNGG